MEAMSYAGDQSSASSSTPNTTCPKKKKKSRKRTGQYCKAYGCSSSKYVYVDGVRVLSGISFFYVPKKVLENKKMSKYWAALVKRELGRDNFTLNKSTVFCEKHFKETDIIRRTNMGVKMQKPRLREGAAPTVHSWVKQTPKRPAPKQRCCPPPKKMKGVPGPNNVDKIGVPELHTTMDTSASCSGPDVDTNMDVTILQPDQDDCATMSPSGSSSSTLKVSVATQTSLASVTTSTQTSWSTVTLSQTTTDSFGHDHEYTFVKDSSQTLESYKDYVIKLESKLQDVEEKCKQLMKSVSDLKAQVKELQSVKFSPHTFKDDDDAIRFYTGLPSFSMLMALYEYLAPKAMHLQHWRGSSTVQDSKPYQRPGKGKPGPKRKCSLLEEFFMVLVRLKVGLFNKDLAVRFGVSETTVSRVLSTWINFLYVEIPAMFPFPSQVDVRAHMPLQFAKCTRIIIDCTEIFIEAPSAMLAQSQTWSNYKHHNTWKTLVGITPNGLVSFVSMLWTGRVSDKGITRESGLLDKLETGDNVMADRGFEIADILPQGVTLNIPPFKGTRDAFSPAEVQETMDIASVRIHVERAIGRIKNFHILDGVMPISLFQHADQIFTVCSYLTNFSKPLVKNE